MSMLQKLYTLKEPTKNGIELANRMASEVNTIKANILEYQMTVTEIHPKLSFLIKDNPTMIKLAFIKNQTLNSLTEQKMTLIQSALNEQQSVFKEIGAVLNILKSKEVDKTLFGNKNFQRPNYERLETESNIITLYDYIDENDLDSLMKIIMDFAENFQDQKSKLLYTQKKIETIPEKLKGCDSGSLSIKAQDIINIQKKVDFNIELADQFNEDYESLILHNNQLNQVITQIQENNMELSDQDYTVLSHDTQEIGLVVGDMQDTLASLKEVVDEIHVKSLQYSSFFEEHKHQTSVISTSFKLIYEAVTDLTLISENVDMMLTQFLNFLNEMWNLVAWYQEFHIAYEELVIEMNRRSLFKRSQQEWIENILQELEALNVGNFCF
ncbi:hypothetical protein BB561_002157 [Smittium simulii]|uniref:Autophagy-related protein 17 n=1 Tax=Smittium simulii TaxID=133385 RepID=A0A2T9YRN3_9FUNG|nr:hypothetical protein BB561_002157 [Smittium simulii]